MSPLELILVILLVIFLLGGFSGRFGGYGYGYGHGGSRKKPSIPKVRKILYVIRGRCSRKRRGCIFTTLISGSCR